MFLLSPFVNLGLKHFNKKQDFVVFFTLFTIFSLLPTILTQVRAFNLNSGYSSLWFIVLYYTGGLIHKYDVFKIFKNYKWLLIYIGCVLISWIIRYAFESLGLIETGFHLHSFNCYLSPLYFIGSIALFCVFKIMNITKSFAIFIINFFTPVCFGVYLIHSNSALAPLFFEGKFTFLAQLNPNFMIIGIIIMGLGIFISCALIDWIRELIFRKLKIKSRFAKFEEKIYLKFDTYFKNNI